jgi:teichuronic acid biosynthesis protein TuaE
MVGLYFISIVIGVGISYSKVYLFHIMFIFMIAYISYLSFIKKKKTISIQKNYIDIFPIFIFIFYSLSLLWVKNIEYGLSYTLYVFFGIGIIYISVSLFKDSITFEKYFKYIMIITIVDILCSLLEIFTSFRLPISPLSSIVHYFGRENHLVLLNDLQLILAQATPTGFQWNPNDLSIYISLALPFVLFSNYKYKIVVFISILIVVVIASSRGVLLSIFLQILLYLFTYSKRRVKFATMYSIVIIPIIGILVYIYQDSSIVQFILGIFDALYNYFNGTDLVNSISIRREYNHLAYEAILNNYGFGLGAGSSVFLSNPNKLISLHNFWLEITVDIGIPFLLLFVHWYFKQIKILHIIGQNKKYNLSYYAQSLSLSMIGFLVSCVSASSVIYFLPMWLMFGISLFLIKNYKLYLKGVYY